MSQFGDLFKLIDDEPDEAARQAALALDKNPNDASALFVIGEVYSRAERFGLAANLYERINVLRPNLAEPFNNLGMCYAGLGDNAKAREAFFKAYNLNKKSAVFTANLGMSYYSERDFKRSIEWCQKSLALEPRGKSATNTLGMCNLSLGNWSEGWQQYASSVGGKFRKLNKYRDDQEPLWDGSPGQTVVFYGEQGLGDEIMYASCIPDAQKVCKTTILECDSRLQGLFRRSFPGVVVHGTRRQQECSWIADQEIDASLPVGQLPQFFRPSTKSCPGTPYLKADPERRVQWRALLDSMGKKPKIGIAWSGGSKHNKPKERAIGLDALRPLFEAIDADWISLQYKDPTEEIKASGLKIHHWKRACETDDYDDTAALVAELDLVIGVHTTAHHLAGALGVPGIVLVPSRTIWIYSLPDGSMPWYKSAVLFRQNEGEKWTATIKRLANDPTLCGLRPEGVGGISRVQPVCDSDGIKTRSDHSAGLELAA